jgi:cytochrome c
MSVLGVALAAALWLAPASTPAVEVNPCAAKTLNPCAAKTLNPCAAKTLNPCGAKLNPCNPCGGASIDPGRFKQPEGARLASGKRLLQKGEELWNDRSLGKTGVACSTCHIDDYGQMNATFAKPYPHYVAMPAQQAGVKEVTAAEMVNFCMIVPMGAESLAWNSQELAALTAYVEHIQPGYRSVSTAGAMNPCNPCAAKRNPCGSKNGNPCNPCGARR